MKDFSKEDLIGYVLGALEPGEERRIEYALQSSTELRNQLADVEELLAKMPDRFTEIDPPESLTQKTINTIGIVDDSMRQLGTENIAVNRGVKSSAEEIPAVTLSDKASSGNKRQSNKTGSNKTRSNKTLSENKESSFNYRRNWSAADVLVGCAVCLLIAVVLLPSISKSRFQAQRLQCQDNLRAIGYKFANVADSFEGRINLNIPGNQLSASQYVEKLILADVLNCEQFVCPSDPEKEETIRRRNWKKSSKIKD